MSTPAAVKGKDIHNYLSAGISIPLPAINWNDPQWNIPYNPNDPIWAVPQPITIDELTEGTNTILGAGTFDVIMQAVMTHLKKEYKEGRITGSEYTKAYTASMEMALGNGVEFLMQSNDAYYKALAARMTAMLQFHEMALAKLKYAELFIQKLVLESEFSNKVLNLTNLNESAVTEIYNHSTMLPAQKNKVDSETAINAYTLSSMLPAQRGLILAQTVTENYQGTVFLPAQKAKVDSETAINTYTLSAMLPSQKALVDAQTVTEVYQGTQMLPAQKALVDAQKVTEVYQGTKMLPSQRDMVLEQIITEQFNNTQMLLSEKALKDEQREATRAQTLNTRSDGSTVVGLLGKQKDLYNQQIIAYQRDSEVKAGKMFLEHYITRFTILDGVGMIPAVTDTDVGAVMQKIKTLNSLV